MAKEVLKDRGLKKVKLGIEGNLFTGWHRKLTRIQTIYKDIFLVR